MTRTRFALTGTSEQDTKLTTTSSRGEGGTVMRIIVPLQGVVQGRGGLFLGSVIPCALFYFLQLYLKRHRSAPSTPPPPPKDAAASSYQPSSSEGQLPEVSVLSRSFSRIHPSPKSPGGPAYVSSRVNLVLKGGDSPYDIGLRKVSEDPYHEAGNPDGVIQLGLAENKLSLDLVRDWLAENAREAMLGGGRNGEELNIDGIASYQPFDGLMELKVVIHAILSNLVIFNVVLTILLVRRCWE